MNALVDQDLCIGCGLCPSIAPNVFEMREDDKAHAIVDKIPEDDEAEAQESAESCPVNAIAIE